MRFLQTYLHFDILSHHGTGLYQSVNRPGILIAESSLAPPSPVYETVVSEDVPDVLQQVPPQYPASAQFGMRQVTAWVVP